MINYDKITHLETFMYVTLVLQCYIGLYHEYLKDKMEEDDTEREATPYWDFLLWSLNWAYFVIFFAVLFIRPAKASLIDKD